MFYMTVAVLGTLASLGLGETTTRFVAQLIDNDKPRAFRIVWMNLVYAAMMSLLLLGICLTAKDSVSFALFLKPGHADLLLLGCVFILLNCATGALTGFFYALLSFRRVAMVNSIGGAMCIVLGPVAAKGFGLLGFAIAMIIASAVVVGVLGFTLLRYQKQIGVSWRKLGNPFTEARLLGSFAAPALASAFSVQFANWLSGYILVHQPGGIEQMAILYAVNQWFFAAMFLPTIFGQVTLPMIARAAIKPTRVPHVLGGAVAISAAMAAAPMVLAVLLAPSILAMYSAYVAEGAYALRVSLMATVLMATVIPLGQLFVSFGQVWLGALTNVIWGGVFIAGTAAWVAYGVDGIANARLLSYVIHTLTSGFIAALLIRQRSWREYRDPMFLKRRCIRLP
jgi:O-antigen/teichoic acid export membrane protein